MNSTSNKHVASAKKFSLSISCSLIAFGFLLTPFMERANAAGLPFYLKPGDHVCFYGDSITEQRFYGVDVATYVRTR
ncbi:MAG: hypothetical protein ACREDS_10395, partial [Limisphaerales bacterium]